MIVGAFAFPLDVLWRCRCFCFVGPELRRCLDDGGAEARVRGNDPVRSTAMLAPEHEMATAGSTSDGDGSNRCGKAVASNLRGHTRALSGPCRNAWRSPPRLPCLVSCSAPRRQRRRWPPRRTLFPQPAVPENLLDHLSLAPLDEANNAHGRTTLGTGQRIRLVDLFEERGPAFSGFPSRGQAGRGRGALRRRLPLSPLPSGLVRVPPVIPDEVFPRFGDVLRL